MRIHGGHRSGKNGNAFGEIFQLAEAGETLAPLLSKSPEDITYNLAQIELDMAANRLDAAERRQDARATEFFALQLARCYEHMGLRDKAAQFRALAEPGPDVLSHYAHTEHGRRVGGQEAVAAVMSVVVAGWESTAGLIGV